MLSFGSLQNLRAAVPEPTFPMPFDDGAALPAPDQADQADQAEQAERAELAALLGASAAGDARAFENFYHRTVRHASAVARRIVGDNHLEDVLSDAYFQAWREAARFNAQRGSARGWLLAIARSRALDRLRQECVRHGGLRGAPDPGEREDEDQRQPGPDDLLASTEACSQLHAAVARLSVNERWVLGLAYFRDLNHTEIAALTELPLGTVKSLISRSQHKLRDALCAHAPMNRAAL